MKEPIKYTVPRVSAGYDEQPCKEAILEYNSHHDWDEWTVELDGIKGLNSFIKKHGTIIMNVASDTRHANITIYDDYCE